jgi:predicted RNase H-like HicB family nuclease
MIDSTRPDAVLADTVIDALDARGFAVTVVERHAVATRDAVRVVVPAPGRTVPETFVRRLEHALRPVLGPGWIDGPVDDPAEPTGAAAVGDVLVLDAVVDPCEGGEWCAFLPAELSVMGTGAERDDALRDLKAAAALWLGVPVDRVVLMTPDVL